MNGNRNLKYELKRSAALLLSATMLGMVCAPQVAVAAQEKAQARKETNVTAGASSMMLNSASTGLEAAGEDKDDPWGTRLLAKVDDSVNVRKEAGEHSEIVGKLHKGDLAQIISAKDGWYEIESGDVNGYVSAEYAVIGQEAKELAKEVCKLVAKVTTDGLRVREKADGNAKVLTVLNKKDTLEAVSKVPDEDGWIKVTYDGEDAYVSADYVKVKRNYGRADTLEQEEKEKAKAATETSGATTTTSGVNSSDVYWLAAIASHESSTYQGQLAVAAVVLNRVKSSQFPSSVSAVITAPGQFVGASTIAGMIRNGLSQQSLQAAQAALAGQDPTDGCLFFWSSRTGHAGVNIGGNVFWK